MTATPEDEKGPLQLSEEEEKKVEEATSMAAIIVHEAVRKEGEAELGRPSSALAWSGLAAGLSMGFTLFAEGLLHSHLPDTPWRPLISKFGYTIGFLIVILGRQQLFTENTLTVILPLLSRRDRTTLMNVMRLWSIVLVTNLVGAWLFTLALQPTLFAPEVLSSFTYIGKEAMAPGAYATFFKAIFGGWLIALMVWLLPGSESSRIPTIIIITYFVGLGKMSHVIGGSAETLYLVTTGQTPFSDYLVNFLLPTMLGNVVGGVALVAALNHAQVVAGTGKGAAGGKSIPPRRKES